MTEHVLIPNEMPDAVRHEIAMLLCSGGRNVASDIYRKVIESGIPAQNYDRRITELLEANNREVFRRREAEAKLSSTATAAPTTMENAAFVTEPKIDTSPDALDKLADSAPVFPIDDVALFLSYILRSKNIIRALAAQQRRDAELVRELVGALERILNPSPGVAKLPPWVYGIAGAAIAKARAQGGGE